MMRLAAFWAGDRSICYAVFRDPDAKGTSFPAASYIEALRDRFPFSNLTVFENECGYCISTPFSVSPRISHRRGSASQQQLRRHVRCDLPCRDGLRIYMHKSLTQTQTHSHPQRNRRQAITTTPPSQQPRQARPQPPQRPPLHSPHWRSAAWAATPSTKSRWWSSSCSNCETSQQRVRRLTPHATCPKCLPRGPACRRPSRLRPAWRCWRGGRRRSRRGC
ncbi:hypothetical protein BJ546DRAFT_561002 [Cryomyces antarcticus]